MQPREHFELLLAKAAQDEYAMDVLLADPLVPDEVIGFHAQQAAEKLLKAAIAAMGAEYPRSHRLAELIDLARACGANVPDALDEVRMLTPFAVELRYGLMPSADEEPLDRPHVRAMLAELRAWVEGLMPEQPADEVKP